MDPGGGSTVGGANPARVTVSGSRSLALGGGFGEPEGGGPLTVSAAPQRLQKLAISGFRPSHRAHLIRPEAGEALMGARYQRRDATTTTTRSPDVGDAAPVAEGSSDRFTLLRLSRGATRDWVVH